MVESYDTYDRCNNQFVSAVYCVLYLVCVRLTRSGRSEPRQRGTSVISEVAASSRLTAGDAESVEEGGNMIGPSLHEANKVQECVSHMLHLVCQKQSKDVV